ncbi:ABC transporter [Xylariomycetidae sp. FL2044]|nr:ABC transporter [Xylariomycetidae sp. FL2044]
MLRREDQQAVVLVDGFISDHVYGASLPYAPATQHDAIWDPVQARLAPRVFPYIRAIPLFVIAIILICVVLRVLFPRPPTWMTKFVRETRPEIAWDDVPANLRPTTSWTVGLYAISSFACVIQSYRTGGTSSHFTAISWAFALVFVVATRPASTSWPLLSLYIAIFASQVILLANASSGSSRDDVLDKLSLVASIAAIVTVVLMPMRSTHFSREGISPVGATPTKMLRSPEDDITLWQWMTVSWMAPLLSVEKTKQIDGDDVWALGYEFQNARLHDLFGVLRGSVIRRLLNANGFDMIVLCGLGIIELVAFLSQPVILQQLLASMENPESPVRAAIIFAILQFVASFVDTQCCCFGLWIGRRIYERSRGEMITMLYEKTLKRKIFMVPHVKSEEELANDDEGSASDRPQPPQGIVNRAYQSIKHFTSRPYRKLYSSLPTQHLEPESKHPASIGKILDIVKGDVFEVAQQLWEVDKYLKRFGHIIFSIFLIWKLLGSACLLGALTVICAQVITALIARILLRWEKIRRHATDVKLHAVSQFVEAVRHLRWYGWQDVWRDEIIEKRQKELNYRLVTSAWSMLVSLVDGLASGMFPFVAFYAYTVLLGQPLRVDTAFPALALFRNLEYNLKQVPALITKFLNAYVALQRVENFLGEIEKPDVDERVVAQQQQQQEQIILEKASFAWPGKPEPFVSDVSLTFVTGLHVIVGKVAAGKTALLLALIGELDQVSGEYARSNGAVGYCAQAPWLLNTSIKENILFHSPYDEARYKEVLSACALMADLATFKRAMYSSARTLILDDPLSALDAPTASWVVANCLKGSLVRGRIVILATHRLDICRSAADQLIEIEAGTARVIGKGEYCKAGTTWEASKNPELHPPSPEDIKQDLGAEEVDAEHRERGGVKYSVYWQYIKAGKARWWLCLVLFLAASRVISVGQSWFLKEWGEAYNRVADQRTTSVTGSMFNLPNPEANVRRWLVTFLVIAVAQIIASLIGQVFMVAIVYSAGKRMFRDVLGRVARASFRFYDNTPTGRLMNRMVSDMGEIDGNASRKFQEMANLSTIWISCIVVIASVTPIFFAYSLVMTAAFVYFFLKFLPASHSLRRLSMTSLSPLMTEFGALVDGLTTIRAFRAQAQFQSRLTSVVDTFQKMDHFYWSLQAWLNYRFDALADVSIFLLVLIAIYTKISPGLVAFALVSAQQFVEATHSLCQCYGQLQMDFVSVERVVELLHVEQETTGSINPSALTGDIVLSDVTARYAPHLPPALSDISLTFKAGSKTAIVGRTGSGKSTLALALLGAVPLLEGDGGFISIDGVDLATIDKQILRSETIAYVAQDPLLFPGTLRDNLDPLREHSDAACARVLSQLFPEPIGDSDSLSQGQRQLVGLARMLLREQRRPSGLIVLDEPTASLDPQTSRRVRKVLEESLAGKTVLVITHRGAHDVLPVERCVVLDQGRVVEDTALC